jgi:hypothetical protein
MGVAVRDMKKRGSHHSNVQIYMRYPMPSGPFPSPGNVFRDFCSEILGD